MWSVDSVLQVFFDNYDWPQFVIAAVASALGLLVAAAVEVSVRKLLGTPAHQTALLFLEGEASGTPTGSLKELGYSSN